VNLVPLLLVLLPFFLIVLPVAFEIKRELDKYVPVRVVVMVEENNRKVVIETRKRRLEVGVKDFKSASSEEVLEVRINGLSFGKYRLGLYKGPYGYVESYATSDLGILIDGADGKKYFLAFKNVGELAEILRNKGKIKRVIPVES